MRFLLTLIFILILGSCLGQDTIETIDTIDTIDTMRYGDVTYLYKKGVIQERLHFKGYQIDIKVIYVYREGVLVRREWWQRGKRISYTLE